MDQILCTGNVNVQEPQDCTTFLYVAVENGWYKSAKKLLEYGAYPDALNEKQTPVLYTAVTKSNTQMAGLLLGNGATPDLIVKVAPMSCYSPTPEMNRLLADYSLERGQGQGMSCGRH